MTTRIWRHKKRGTLYFEVGRGELQSVAAPSSEGATMVIYRGDDGRLWVREQSEFEDGRFEEVPDDQLGDLLGLLQRTT